ncbi:unnamed protein product [Prunus brigantina]
MFELCMEFPSLEQCREAIRYYAVTSARPLKWVRNDPHRARVTCAASENVVQKGEQVENGGKGEQIRNCENGEDSGNGVNGENDEGQIVKCDWLLYTSHVGKWTATTTKTYHPKHPVAPRATIAITCRHLGRHQSQKDCNLFLFQLQSFAATSRREYL